MEQDTHTVKKQKKKNFLAPLKTKDGPDGSKLDEDKPTSASHLQKKAESVNPLKVKGNADNGKSMKIQKLLKPNITTDTVNKKDHSDLKRAKESKKAKKGDSAGRPKSLSDTDYEDLFNAVLQRVTTISSLENDEDSGTQAKEITCKTESDNKSEKEEKEPKEISKKSGENCDNDLDSIASDDVDAWADSPIKDEAEDNQHTQPTLKPKCVVQKKAKRSGILKPKQLIFSETENKEAHKKMEAGPDNKKGIKSHDVKPKDKDIQSSAVKSSPLVDFAQAKRKQKEVDSSKSSKDKNKKKKKREGNKSAKSDSKLDPNKKESDDEQEEEIGTWIQCSNKECGKWRYVAGIEDPIVVPAVWECKMNPDKEHNACDLPEVDYDESEHICTKFTIGSLVWAKMDGYPWWPGMIEADPDYDTYFELLTEKSMVPFQYHVTFFDDHVTRAWIRTNFISPYIKGHEPANKVSKGRNSYQKEIRQAINNADKAVSLGLQERISTFGFSQRYNKKSRMKVNQTDKTKPKSTKKFQQEKKTEKESVQSTETQYKNDSSPEDSSDFNELSDILEDTEYKPVKTKSRGLKETQADEDVPTLEARSTKRDYSSEEDEAESSPDTCLEKSGGILLTETKLDPDVFTMELDSACPSHHCDHITEKSQCETSDNFDNKDVGINEQENKNDSIAQEETKLLNSDDINKELRIGSNVHQDKESAQENKKRIKGKLALKSKTPDSSYREKHETPKLTEDKGKIKTGDTDNANISKDDKIAGDCENKAKEQHKNLEKLSEYNDGATNASKKDKKKHKTKQMDDITAANNDSTKDPPRGGKKKKRNEKEQINNETDLKMEKCTHSDNEMAGDKTKYTNQKVMEKSEKDSKEEEALKNKLKKTKSTKAEDDSDKENVEPFGDKTIGRVKDNKKRLKRQASASISLNTTDFEKDSDTDTQKSKKSKSSLTSDGDGKIATKKKKVKEEKPKQNKDEVNFNKKKVKSFAAPLKMCKSTDREVPQLSSHGSKEDFKNKACTESNLTEDPLNSDQHIVPDMSQESETLAHLDTDMELPTFNERRKGRNKIVKLSEKEIFRSNEDDTNNDESEEEELDLDIDVQKVGPSLPQKFLNDSDGSDIDEMEYNPNKSKVIVENVKDDMQVFGRFAGRCADHGSDSDPMELIED